MLSLECIGRNNLRHDITPASQLIVCMNENFIFPNAAGAILDITKATYLADPTGKRDCTAALRQAMDDALGEVLRLRNETLQMLERLPEPNGAIGFENKKIDGNARMILLHRLLEKRDGVSKRLMSHELPERYFPQFTLPLYLGYT